MNIKNISPNILFRAFLPKSNLMNGNRIINDHILPKQENHYLFDQTKEFKISGR